MAVLKSLTQSDIDAIIEACGPPESAPAVETGLDASSPERERVYAIVEHLSREAQEELLALMWTGGPKNQNNFKENLEIAHKTGDENHATHIAEQHARLPIYLRDGLNRISAEQG
ncbi:MAG TPA: DUF3775 domain-containing protein [Rhizomicrobium sp.]|nr:DUF3775 domain-containing protein [Rhizomicrobium sp.]